ncbi:DOMON-like domain-containing protein [Sphingosinicella sp.]|uniref:DOMON-like domain-containing protein n=1 Tax=Sphingosinicella sp. TaxID=1917971 RepID=UPI00403812A3
MAVQVGLSPHPAYPAAAVDEIEVVVERPSADAILLRYLVSGRPDELLLPEPAPPLRADNLWRTTCFEAFIAAREGTAYLEFNFSPSSQWAAYDLAVYRDPVPMNAALRARPEIALTREEARLEVSILFTPDLRADYSRLGLSAVIEDKSGAKSFWALRHGGDAPDFHDRACFALELPPAPAP